MKFFCAVTLFMWSCLSIASSQTYYEPKDLNELTNGQKTNNDLLDFISSVSHKSFHPLGYKRGAKPALFGEVDLERDENGYFVKDVYCNFKIRHRVGPNKVPNNNTMNTEHTWPQSKGSKSEPFRGDLHHLFPTDSRANSMRGNYPFGEVDGKKVSASCEASKSGFLIDPISGKTTGKRGYQPPLEHRGNVARALFYSAAFYNKHISELEEHHLKKWHWEDPVDQREIDRNDRIEEAQGNRNPYIDFPELVDRIEDF